MCPSPPDNTISAVMYTRIVYVRSESSLRPIFWHFALEGRCTVHAPKVKAEVVLLGTDENSTLLLERQRALYSTVIACLLHVAPRLTCAGPL